MNRLSLSWSVGLLVTMVVSMTYGTVNPGLQMKVTKSGLKYVSKVAVEYLKSDLAAITIPDMSGVTHIDVIGHVTYELKNLKVTSLDLPDTLVGTVSDTGVKVSIANAKIGIHGDWHYYNHGFIHISDHGSIEVSASFITMSLIIQVGNSRGQFSISTSESNCTFNVGSLDVDFHGGASWLYNLFSGDISHEIKKNLNKQVCGDIVKEVNGDMAKQVEDIKLVSNIDKYAYVNYSLVTTPKFSSQNFLSFHKGEIISRKDHQDVPVPSPPIPADTESSRMLYIWLTEYASASAAYVYYKSGILQYNITKDMVPSPFTLNTSKFPFNTVIPQLEKHYPNLDMVIDGKITSPPVLNMTTRGLKGGLVGLLEFYAIEKNKTSRTFLFSLNVNMDFSASPGFNTANCTITANVTLHSSSFKLVKSNKVLGDISGNIKNLDILMDMLFSTFLMPEINQRGAEGLPIPSVDGVNLVKPVITFGKGFIQIATDINYMVDI